MAGNECIVADFQVMKPAQMLGETWFHRQLALELSNPIRALEFCIRLGLGSYISSGHDVIW